MAKDTKKISEKIARECLSQGVDFAEAGKFLRLVVNDIADGDIGPNALSDFEYVIQVLDETGAESALLSYMNGFTRRLLDYNKKQSSLEREQQRLRSEISQFAKELKSVARRW